VGFHGHALPRLPARPLLLPQSLDQGRGGRFLGHGWPPFASDRVRRGPSNRGRAAGLIRLPPAGWSPQLHLAETQSAQRAASRMVTVPLAQAKRIRLPSAEKSTSRTSEFCSKVINS